MSTTLAPSQSVTDRDPKGTKFVSIVAAAYNKAGLSEDEAQRVNDTPGLADLIASFIEENRFAEQFKDEEVDSSYGYLSGYSKPKPLGEQATILRQLFLQLASTTWGESLEKAELPAGAEGLFAIPDWKLLAPTYGEAVQLVLDKIKEVRGGKFHNYIAGQLGPTQLRQHQKTAEAFQKLGKAQAGHGILVVPAQFGICHRGRSVRRAREVMSAQEFGLGAFAIGIMILTHSNRLENYDDLRLDCAGDERSPDADGSFGDDPLFYFDDGRVGLGDRYVRYASGHFGSVSGFLSQELLAT